MSAVLRDSHSPRRPSLVKLGVLLGVTGGTLGLIAGLVELFAGPAILDWVGNKQDTTRLGIVTVLLAALALMSAFALLRGSSAAAKRRSLIALGLLLPGFICFTTVGRLWYVPGALLVAAGAVVAAGVWHERRAIVAAAERSWTATLVAVLALVYIFLGVTALGRAGVLGVAGGLVILALVVAHGKIARPLALGLLLVATLPFATVTWWSVATPLAGSLLLTVGVAVLGRRTG